MQIQIYLSQIVIFLLASVWVSKLKSIEEKILARSEEFFIVIFSLKNWHCMWIFEHRKLRINLLKLRNPQNIKKNESNDNESRRDKGARG